MVAYGISLHWLVRIFPAAAVPLWAIVSLFVAAFCLLLNIFRRRIRSPVLLALFASTLWTAIEFYRSELFFLRFPWITPGSSLGPTWLSPIVGVYGASFIVFLVSAALLRWRTFPIALAAALAVSLLRAFPPGPVVPATNACINVAAVQSEECFLRSYLSLTAKGTSGRSQLVVWPEYSVPYDIRQRPDDLALVKDLCVRRGITLVFGTKTTEGPGKSAWRNTALTVDARGVIGEYYKARPVHFFDDGLPGVSYDPIQTRLGAMGTPICFDCDYTEVLRRMTLRGADFFAVPSFDAKEWSSDQHVQHAVLFRLRAAENRRWLVCAASSGVSQIIDPHGNVGPSLGPMRQGAISGVIARGKGLTFFTTVGWLFPWVAIVVSIVWVASMSIKIVRERRDQRSRKKEAVARQENTLALK